MRQGMFVLAVAVVCLTLGYQFRMNGPQISGYQRGHPAPMPVVSAPEPPPMPRVGEWNPEAVPFRYVPPLPAKGFPLSRLRLPSAVDQNCQVPEPVPYCYPSPRPGRSPLVYSR